MTEITEQSESTFEALMRTKSELDQQMQRLSFDMASQADILRAEIKKMEKYLKENKVKS